MDRKKSNKQQRRKRDQYLADFLLDKADLVITASYALVTQDYWTHIINNKATMPEMANLTAFTLALCVAWAIIGHIKSGRK